VEGVIQGRPASLERLFAELVPGGPTLANEGKKKKGSLGGFVMLQPRRRNTGLIPRGGYRRTAAPKKVIEKTTFGKDAE